MRPLRNEVFDRWGSVLGTISREEFVPAIGVGG
jgi:hypothetical protein